MISLRCCWSFSRVEVRLTGGGLLDLNGRSSLFSFVCVTNQTGLVSALLQSGRDLLEPRAAPGWEAMTDRRRRRRAC